MSTIDSLQFFTFGIFTENGNGSSEKRIHQLDVSNLNPGSILLRNKFF